MKCEYCDKEHDASFGSGRFCNRSCANVRAHSQNTKNKIGASVKKFMLEKYGEFFIGKTSEKVLICEFCKSKFIAKSSRKYCNSICARKSVRFRTDKSYQYRSDCKFDFNIYDYPDKFDLDLVKEYGWYSASNRGNNLNGISRDHIVSIKYGFKNNVSVEIMSHPANCQLLRHFDNLSKGKKNGMSLEELYTKVKDWK